MKLKLITVAAVLYTSLAVAQTTLVSYEYWFNQDTANRTTQAIGNTSINASSLSSGYHTLYMRVKDSNGKWSSVLYREFNKPNNNFSSGINAYQYWFDTDTANTTTVAITAAAHINQAAIIGATALAPGEHTLYMRTKENNGNWSAVLYRNFVKPANLPTNKIVSVRFWSDTTNTSNPIDMQQFVFPTPAQYLDYSALLDFCSSTIGNRKMFFQLRDTRGYWSAVISHSSYNVNMVSTGAPTGITVSQSGTNLVASSPWGIQWYEETTGLLVGETNDTLSNPQQGNYYAVITNNCGTDTSNIVPVIISEIGKQADEMKVSVFPNPSNGYFTIQINEEQPTNTVLTITNAMGAVVWQQELAARRTTFFLNNATGVYFANLGNDKTSIIKRIVIE
jgi:hypothetical protein